MTVREMEIQIGEKTFISKLMPEKAPKTVKAFLSILPLESVTWHQFWSGQGLQCHDSVLKQMARDHGLWPNADFPDYTENPSIYGSAGEVGFYPVGHGLFITYGKCRFFGPPEGVEPTYIFAKITEDLEELYDLGRHIGRHGQQKIILREHK
ncbi:DUF3830 family protein [Candidatus Bathyarchaeota archaeon]|nr:DUF3830 family protein [Candidatus Bathyarchaeota archaeon]